ncbi:MAG: EamA family transporter [Bacteroidetes bacterium]|nr:EamA family transporter [Bacteroidota bacterium]
MPRYSKLVIFLAFAAVYIIWGSTYLAILIGLRGLSPWTLCTLRFLLAGILLFGWRLLKREKIPSMNSIRINSICGALMLCGGVGSVCWAEQYISSSLAAIIVTALPFWFVIFDRKKWTFYFSNKIIIAGLLVGFAGVMLLVGFDHSPQQSSHKTGNELAGILVILFGGICWSSGSLYSKYHVTGSSILMNGAIQLFIAGILSFIISIIAGEWKNFQFANVSTDAWLAALYLVTMGSIVAFVCYLFLLKVRPAAQVSTYVYANPVVAVFLGALIAGEKITGTKIIALLVILSGVLLVNLPSYKNIPEKIVASN